MPYSEDIEKKITSFHTIEDIISAMKAYAGVTMRKTEQIVPNIREYENNVLSVISELIIQYPALSLATRNGGSRIVVSFGSSQGLCGAYNENVAAAVADFVDARDILFVIGKRLKSALESRHISFAYSFDSVLSVGGIRSALGKTVSQIMDIYRQKDVYYLIFIFTSIFEKRSKVIREQMLPPDVERVVSRQLNKTIPFTYLDPDVIFARALEELLYIGFYRCYTESLRSENWYRMRRMEGASEILRKHVIELSSLQKYIRQEEITEEMLEILGSGMFYG